MKPIHLFGVVLAAFTLQAQTSSQATASTSTLPAPTPYSVVSRDANSAIWQRTTYEQAPDGSIVPHGHQYTELATGLNHLSGGQYVPSTEDIEISPDGSSAAGTNCQHQVYFPGDIDNGVIKLVMPNGQAIESQPVGLAYFDGTNSVLLATVTNSTGAILPSGNQVIYTNVFGGGLIADLIFSYTKAGMEQDVVLKAQPPDPASLGLNPQTTRLQMLTEFLSAPPPSVTASTVPTDAGNLEDDTLSFGAMQMGQGKAFLIGGNSPSVGVDKRWVVIQGRQFLIEEVPIVSIAEAIDILPPFVGLAATGTKPVISKNLVLPPQRLKQTTPKTMFIAQAAPPKLGLVLDYVTVTSQSGFRFQGDTTYYLSGPVTLTGTNFFEGGAVLKYTNGASLTMTVSSIPLVINWLAPAYRPAVFTAKDDNSIGENISGSTGNPTNYYTATALSIIALSGTPTISNFRIAYLTQAMALTGASPALYNGQIVNCQNGITTSGSSSGLRNILFANVLTNFNNLQGGNLQAQNVTFSGSTYLETEPSAYNSVHYTNCIFASITNLTNNPAMGLYGDHNGFYNSPPFGTDTNGTSIYPFQSVGGGDYYLASGCAFTNAGTINIDSNLLASLTQKTTHPPIAYTNVTFTNSLVFSPQATRDTNAVPDLGYHYDPIDYSFGGCIANSNITFTAGTAVGWFRTSSGWYHAGYGIHMGTGMTVSFNGIATAPTYWVRLNTVQEQDLTAGYGPGGIESWTSVNSPTLIGYFMHCSMVGYEGASRHFSDDYGNIQAELTDSEFWGGTLGVYQDYMYYTNCLMWRVGTWLLNGTTTSSYTLRNCTFFGGQFLIQRNSSGPTPVSVRDCSFDGTSISTSDYWSTNTSLTDYDYNAYTNSTDPFSIGGAHDVIVTNGFNWQTSWFGNYYQPTNSPLLNAGDVLASQQGLYHFTILTNQVPEGTNTVSIGYHYVATDTNGYPLDGNGDGIPDYLEDGNGDGIVNNGETNWALAILTQPASQIAIQGSNATFTVGADGVNPLSYRWYFNGSAIGWATNSILTLTNIQLTNEGLYFAIVSNFSGSLTSSVAALEPSGLIGWWPGQGDALDNAGPNNGQLTNGVSFTSGVLGQAFHFDGTNGHILVPDSPVLKPTNLTIEAWVKFDSLDSQTVQAGLQYIVFKQNSTNNNFEGYMLAKLRTGTSDYFDFEVTSASGVNVGVNNSSQAIQTNVWYHVAGVRGSNYIQLYVNGLLVDQTNVDFPQDYGTDPLYFATTGQPNFDGRLAGSLDEVSLYNRALSSNEIDEIYNAELSGIKKCATPPLIAMQPSSQLVTVGTTGILMVSAAGSPPLSYQWSLNGTNLAGATNAILILPNIQSSNAGTYSVVVSNYEGSAVSTNVFLDVESCFSALDVSLVIDDSGSMSEVPLGDGTEKLTSARIAATNFIESLNFTNDQAALFSFNDTVAIDKTLTNNLTDLLDAIATLTGAGGNTVMGNALQFAQAELAGPRHQVGAMPIMVFLSDGQPTDINGGDDFADTSNLVLGAATLVKAAGTRLITIALGTDADTNLMSLMATSPSDTYYATNVSQLTNVYNLIGGSICRGLLAVQIVSPVNQTLLATSNVVISAAVTNASLGATIEDVEFIANDTNILGFAAVPSSNGLYQVNWIPPLAGTNVLRALVTNSAGLTAWSSRVTNYVRGLPSVIITNPVNNQFFSLAPSTSSTNIPINAIALADRATITNVVFYQGTNALGNGTLVSSNVNFTWTNVTYGTYTLFAQGVDSNGTKGISFPVNITVKPTNQPRRYMLAKIKPYTCQQIPRSYKEWRWMMAYRWVVYCQRRGQI